MEFSTLPIRAIAQFRFSPVIAVSCCLACGQGSDMVSRTPLKAPSCSSLCTASATVLGFMLGIRPYPKYWRSATYNKTYSFVNCDRAIGDRYQTLIDSEFCGRMTFDLYRSIVQQFRSPFGHLLLNELVNSICSFVFAVSLDKRLFGRIRKNIRSMLKELRVVLLLFGPRHFRAAPEVSFKNCEFCMFVTVNF